MKKILAVLLTLMMLVPVCGLGEGTEAAEIPEAAEAEEISQVLPVNLNYDYEELTPGPIFEQTEPLIAWIRGLDEGFDATEVAAFRDKFMSACDGHATDRILQWIGIDS